MQQETWTINEIRDGEIVAVITKASHDDAVRAIRAVMSGKADIVSAAHAELHELPLAA